MSMSQWSKLPGELLDAIEEKLVLYIDKVRVRTVCESWSSHLQKMPNLRLRQLPWLLLENNKKSSHSLFNLREKKFYLLDLPEETQGKVFKGSSHGWAVMIQDLDPKNLSIDMHLINPLTREIIQLPPRSAFPDVLDCCPTRVGQEYCTSDDGIEFEFSGQDELLDWTGKVILSSPPSDDDCLVVAIYGERHYLAYCKCNDNKWTSLSVKSSGPVAIRFLDIIFHKNKLYAMSTEGGVIVFDRISHKPWVTEIIAQGPLDAIGYPTYLVECSDGGLLMVCRYVDVLDGEHPNSIIQTLGFRVYKLDLSKLSWIKVKDIGEDMLFVGYNSSISMSSRHFPGYKRNRIYFTDTCFSFTGKINKQEDSDIGIFNLEDESFEQFPGLKSNTKFFWPPPIWVTPSNTY